ncbi:MAG TPA: A/G-specific adenine glycosylase [Chloroflexota bacterium]|nr:A/G-specific adenine glycosylase [Chloroflexota bacterium]
MAARKAVDAAEPAVRLPARKQRAVSAAVLAWYRRSHRDLPWRHTRDPYAILVSEVMLQQTQVERVLPKYLAWLSAYPSVAALAAAPRAEVIRAWSGLGYNLRAVRLHEIARQVEERFGGRIPDTLEGLLSLKGIGRYTAGAVLCFAYGQPAPVLDTNVRRVLGRIFAAEAPSAVDDDRVAWPLAQAALPPAEDVYDWNQALMDVGATICLSRYPRCLLCPAQEHCTARKEWFAPGQTGLSQLAEARATYTPRKPKQGKFEGSRRWYRGRIVDALRAAPEGVAPAELATRIAHDEAATREIVDGLVRDGLVELRGDVARLPGG